MAFLIHFRMQQNGNLEFIELLAIHKRLADKTKNNFLNRVKSLVKWLKADSPTAF